MKLAHVLLIPLCSNVRIPCLNVFFRSVELHQFFNVIFRKLLLWFSFQLNARNMVLGNKSPISIHGNNCAAVFVAAAIKRDFVFFPPDALDDNTQKYQRVIIFFSPFALFELSERNGMPKKRLIFLYCQKRFVFSLSTTVAILSASLCASNVPMGFLQVQGLC